jgi:hypothetical protein
MSPFAISSFILSSSLSYVPLSCASSPAFACTSLDSSSFAVESSTFSASSFSTLPASSFWVASATASFETASPAWLRAFWLSWNSQ